MQKFLLQITNKLGGANLKISSVPYDLLGTGIKYEEEQGRLIITEAKTNKSSYTIGEQTKVSCKVTDTNGATVSGAFVTVEITKPDSSVETVLLSENQPGNYVGIFTDVSLPGTYNAIIKAQKQGYIDATPVNLTFTAERNKIPLGRSLNIINPDIEFYSIYVPDRYGGDFTLTASGGGAIELYYPDPYTKVANAATQINYPVAFNQHGWYYVRVIDRGSISNISNTFVQTGEASYRPWNFWYWPLKKNDDNPQLNLYGEGGALDKYDALFGTQARNYEEYWWGGYVDRRTGREWEGWEGHCWGAAVASILLPQPQAVSYGEQQFNQEEMEGLVSKLGNRIAYGDLLIDNIPSLKPQLGVDGADEFAGKFHTGLVSYLRNPKERKPLHSNLRDPQGINPSAVWNHAVYKYSSIMEEAEEGDEHIIKITTTIYANADIFPSNNNIDRIETYVYKLKYTSDGEIDKEFIDNGQDWISATGFTPKSLFFIIYSPFDGKGDFYNPNVKKENVEKLGIDFPLPQE